MARDPEADAVFRDILASRREDPLIEPKRMFGSTALLVRGKLACFVDGRGRLVAKLPEERMASVRVAGLGVPMEMRGRPMGGWLAVPLSDDADWWALAAEAIAFVDPGEGGDAD